MLKPDKDRLNYSDLLKPPAGYQLAFAVGTTYSLDLEALIGVPLALSLSEEMDQTFMDDPIYMLEGLRRSADNIAIFCEAGQIKVPQNGNSLFALMEDSVFEVALENERSFHPKTWLIKYEDSQGNAIYRLLVLTRNLTFDRSWDIALALEGKMQQEPAGKNRPLVDFLRFLLTQATSEKKQKRIEEMMAELEHVHFESGDKHVAEFDFYPLGIKGYEVEDTGLFESYHQLILMSPFLSQSTIAELNGYSLTAPTKVLITRRAELHKLTEEIINDFDVYVLKDIIVEGEGAFSEEDEENEAAQLQDIHAKMYARSKYNEHQILIGSANSSHYAFNGNVEFLLRMQYKKYGFRITDLLVDLFGEEEEDNPFEKVESIPEEEETETEITDKLQKAIKQLCQVKSRAFVQKENDSYSVHLSFESIPDDIEFSIGPLLSKKIQDLQHEMIINDLSILELGEFYVVKAEQDGETVERIIKIETEGLPEERNQEIYRSIINNPYAFLQYIAFLLADDFLLSAFEQMEQKKFGSGAWDLYSISNPVLYENMLKAAARSSEKLQDIHKIIEIIDDDTIIPEEFYRLYDTFNQATKLVEK
ncbi:phospholipase D family protein [Alkalihalobacillus sp. AL-G]|uniref:phospholipase D family protein n=1 Tax=Alkalihalobacillus sp. AL-G TaxID=2926399 RepID=UPI002729D9FF|nr:phospholipase D family protein [Alkalihalobacillus sp. AL-G]WLD94464.1 phospholipase D family protein [Alkalihalobacillus sp. AL-G]